MKYVLLFFTIWSNTAFALDCSKLDLVGNWKTSAGLIGREVSSSVTKEGNAYSSVETDELSSGTIFHEYLHLDFDVPNCIIHQNLYRLTTTAADTPNIEVEKNISAISEVITSKIVSMSADHSSYTIVPCESRFCLSLDYSKKYEVYRTF